MSSKPRVVAWEPWDQERLSVFGDPLVTDAHYEALAEHMREHGYIFGGPAHQSPDVCGVPVFSDGARIMEGHRGWGGLMADIYGLKDGYGGTDWAYTNWAWCHETEEGTKMPPCGEVDPATERT